jgi:hypothetical protein
VPLRSRWFMASTHRTGYPRFRSDARGKGETPDADVHGKQLLGAAILVCRASISDRRPRQLSRAFGRRA